jgi:hypothetical protein
VQPVNILFKFVRDAGIELGTEVKFEHPLKKLLPFVNPKVPKLVHDVKYG